MDEQNTNSSNQSQDLNRPRLKKVKRPIRRIVPQSPVMPETSSLQETPVTSSVQAASATTDTQANPFASGNSTLPRGNFDNGGDDIYEAFSNQELISEEENLPSLTNYGQQTAFDPQHPQFLGTVPPKSQEMAAPTGEGFYMNGERVSKNVLFLILAAVFMVGFIIAKLFFAEEKIVKGGLQGVVVNAEVPKGRARCGTTDKSQGCVLYLMNPQRNELLARDFYDLASQLTGRQRFIIETGNMRYSTTRIKPGQFGQFNIPPLQ